MGLIYFQMKKIIFFALLLSAATGVETFARSKSNMTKTHKVIFKKNSQKLFEICCQTASVTYSFSSGGATCTVTVSSTVCTTWGCAFSQAAAQVIVQEAVKRMEQ
jgi:hypothetical protein